MMIMMMMMKSSRGGSFPWDAEEQQRIWFSLNEQELHIPKQGRGCKYSFNRIMRLSDQQQLEIRSLPSQCMRSKFLPLLSCPTGISPLSSCRDDPAVALQSLGHPTAPRKLCHLQLGKFNALLSPSDYRTTEAAILCGTIAQEGFF